MLDASALLAYLQGEVGADRVRAALGEAVISTVNWAEVVQKAGVAAHEAEALREDAQSLGLVILPFSVSQAENHWKATAKHCCLRPVLGRSGLPRAGHRHPERRLYGGSHLAGDRLGC